MARDMAVLGEKMSNVFQDHPWLNYVAVALATSVVNGVVGKFRKVFTSPGREDFQQLETRLTQQINSLQQSVAQGMQNLEGKIAGVYQRLDDKTDALNERIDAIALGRNGGR